jgi:arylsulfatase A-like enzyme
MSAVAQDSSPNVVLIVADDLGYSDCSFNGSQDIPTPNIDRIASRGVMMTDAYVTCPQCAPSRAGILTGRYQQRFGFEINGPPGDQYRPIYGIPKWEPILPERLRALGYATGMVGKWHLGEVPGNLPNDRGFDSFFGFLEAQNNYLSTKVPEHPFYENTTQTSISKYLTEEFSDHAVRFIDQNAGQKFFLYLPFNACHAPLESTPLYRNRFPNLIDPRRRVAAVVSAMDDAVGNVLNELERKNLQNNTLVIFISDNGGNVNLGSLNNPLGGMKASVSEGGIRVPCAISWPGRLSKGVKYSGMVSGLDIVPTVMAAAGSPVLPDRTDGVNLIPYLRAYRPITSPPRETLFWRWGVPGWPYKAAETAIRWRNFKYMAGVNNDGLPFEGLYDLSQDIAEKYNLLDQLPDVAAKMKADWAAWNSTMREPLWPQPLRAFFGNVRYASWLGPYDRTRLTIDIKVAGTDTLIFTRRPLPTPNATYNFTQDLRAGSYDLYFKTPRFLRKKISGVQVPKASVVDVTQIKLPDFRLTNGDANQDNVVDQGDFAAVKAAMGTTSSTQGWNWLADLNGDLAVTQADLNIVLKNYGKIGD